MVNSFAWGIWVFIPSINEFSLCSFLVEAWQYNFKILNCVVKTSLNGSLRGIFNTCCLLSGHKTTWFLQQRHSSFNYINWHINFWTLISFTLISFMNVTFVCFRLIWSSWSNCKLIFDLFLYDYFIMILPLLLFL